MFANNWDGGTYINGLDYTIYPNEHCRVDVLQPNANPFSTSPADIIQNFFLGGAPVGAPQAYTHYSFTASDVSPGTYMLRFAEVDNSGYFSQGVDNVRVYTPEPSSALFLLTALPFAGLLRRRK